jgi:pimeloyl-ACP methyl ester carboxylesterase
LLLAPPLHAAPAADWLRAPGAEARYVGDPVFGGRVAVYEAGPKTSDAVVLVHGLGQAAARDWSRVIPALAGRYRVLALDLPGFGQSDRGNHHYSPDNFARVLEALLQERGLRRVALIGHSMGGTVALAYAAAYPERVSRLIVVDAAGVLHRSVYAEFLARVAAQRAIGIDSPWYESVVRAIQYRMENWPLRGDLDIEREGVRHRLLRGDPSAISAYAMVDHDFSAALRSIAAPTLVIWGSADSIAPLRTGQALASAIPRARLVIMEGVGHAPMIEVPDRFNPIVLDELDGRQLAAPPYALAAAPAQGKRTARCDNRRSQEFSGDYESLVLENCAGAQVSNARIGHLQLVHSTVSVVNSHVRTIEARNSRVELTGGSVGAGLTLDASSVDAAATRFESEAIARNGGGDTVVLRLSVATVGGAKPPRMLHDIYRLAPGETLIR